MFKESLYWVIFFFQAKQYLLSFVAVVKALNFTFCLVLSDLNSV